MDDFGGVGLSTMSKASRKRRSNLSRHPSNESELPRESDFISFSSIPSDPVSDAPSECNTVHEGSNRKKEPSLSHCFSRVSGTNLADAEKMNENCDEDVVIGEANDLKGLIEDDPAASSLMSLRMGDNTMNEIVTGHQHSRQLETSPLGIGNRNKFNKVKLKVGGITHTIHTRCSSDGSSVAGTSTMKSTSLDAIYPPHEPSQQENSNLHFIGENSGLRGVPWKDFTKTGFSFGRGYSLGVHFPQESVKGALKHRQSGKSAPVNEQYLSDEVYDEEDDDEIRYLRKLKTSKIACHDNSENEEEIRGKKLQKISKVMDRSIRGSGLGIGCYDSSRSGKERKKSRTVRASEDTEFLEDDESVFDGEIHHKNKKPRKESINLFEYSMKESSIRTRRRATLTGGDISPVSASSIQFPDGLPPARPRKPKEQLSELEQQMKRAEAAQRRRIQNEKAARESEIEAIRKILGQDSSRKRREEKIKKRQEELAQERSMSSAKVPANVVRWVIRPSGTVVIFPDEVGLPSIFEPKPCSYPPPREKCVGPSCTNAYKYRDSKSKLPLCSLQCYKAIHESTPPLPAC